MRENPYADRTPYVVVRNSERYGTTGDNFGDRIAVLDLLQARYLAKVMTNYYPGCDDLFTVEGDDENSGVLTHFQNREP